MLHRFEPALIIVARIISGLLLAGFSSMVSIAVAWGLFVFSSSQSIQAWSILQICAAGTGAGLGSIVAWFKIDRNTSLLLTLMVAVAILGGLAGAWIGYEYGAYRSSLCCDKSGFTFLLSPITSSALGSSLMANLAMLVFGLARKNFPALNKLSNRGAPMANARDASNYRSVNH